MSLGIIMSCVGAGLQSLTGAPQLLNAIASDDVIPCCRKIATAKGDPRKAVWLTWLVTTLACFIGNMDAITPIITMFFLAMYASINLSCGVLSLTKAPSFRPTWKYYSWWTAMTGFVMCLVMMFVISWLMALVAWAFAAAVGLYIGFNSEAKNWGDGFRGLYLSAAKSAIIKLGNMDMSHEKNWRPQLLVLTKVDWDMDENNPDLGMPKHPNLITLAQHLKKGQGFTQVSGVVQGTLTNANHVKLLRQAEDNLKEHIRDVGLTAFSNLFLAENLKHGIWSLVQMSGMTGLRPNTVMLLLHISVYIQSMFSVKVSLN